MGILHINVQTPEEVYDSDQLSKHSSATYALHRITSHLSTHLLLPPTMRDQWEKFNDV
jgi:hypothetical protein